MEENSSKIKFIQYGLGPIGQRVVESALSKPELQLVGAIDIDPLKVGRDVGNVLNLPKEIGVTVSEDPEEVLSKGCHIVLHTTASFLSDVRSQLKLCLESGANVISTTEELLYPWYRNPEISSELDKLARRNNATLLGTGVNPGFVMDILPLTMTGICTDVKRIEVLRVVDVSRRRSSLQRKVGTGISVEEFQRRKKTGKFGHVGLVESLVLIARGLEWELDDVIETLDPVIAGEKRATEYFEVNPGSVAGIHQVARGIKKGEECIVLELKMYVGAEEPGDTIHIEGNPPVKLVIKEGIMGDTATAASVLNAIPHVVKAREGLITVMDLPVPRLFS